MTMQTPLGRVRGLGSAKEGVHHWKMQRVSAIALVPLTLWFILSIVGHAGAEHAEIVEWMQSPYVATALLLLIYATFYHLHLGLQVVIEDYISDKGQRLIGLVVMKFIAIGLGVLAAVSVLKVALGG